MQYREILNYFKYKQKRLIESKYGIGNGGSGGGGGNSGSSRDHCGILLGRL